MLIENLNGKHELWEKSNKMKNILYSILLLIFCNSCTEKISNSVLENKTVKSPKNIILMIGDGMGLSQITAGLYANMNHLNLEYFESIGLHKSYSGNDLVTDSAAGATAFSCGCKSFNSAISVKIDSTPCPTIMEQLKSKGYTTGILVTCSITHATPACFYAHQINRDLNENIALDMLKSGPDMFVGGGEKYFVNRKNDNRDLISELRSNGYVVHDYKSNKLENEILDPNKKYGFFTADNSPTKASEGRDYEITIVDKTLDYLAKRSKGNGFFYMIEGSQIDWGGHDGNSDYIIAEMKNFDKTIGKVLDFAKKDGNTLIVITADHETGGYAVLKGSKMGEIVGGFADKGKSNSKSLNHTASLIPVFAFGPGAEKFQGIYENTAIYDKIHSFFK